MLTGRDVHLFRTDCCELEELWEVEEEGVEEDRQDEVTGTDLVPGGRKGDIKLVKIKKSTSTVIVVSATWS